MLGQVSFVIEGQVSFNIECQVRSSNNISDTVACQQEMQTRDVGGWVQNTVVWSTEGRGSWHVEDYGIPYEHGV